MEDEVVLMWSKILLFYHKNI